MTSAGPLPTFLVIGAAKAGTTTLYEILRQHPQVFLPSTKEPAFFCDDEYYEQGADWYRRTYFGGAGGRVSGEATSTYLFWSGKVVPRLQHTYGAQLPRIIAIFRDPVALVHSFYWHSVREGREDLGLPEALAAEPERLAQHDAFLRRRGRIVYSYRQIARYASHLQPFLASIPPARRLFLLTEDLRDSGSLVKKLEAFLELEQTATLRPVVSNAAALPRSPQLHRWLRGQSRVKDAAKRLLPRNVRQWLKARAIDANLKPFQIPPIDPTIGDNIRRGYAEEMKRLEGIIGRDLSHWYAT
ncbi:MAG: sulfotransferase domain-containing protein [Vicinamibacterales bacterium]